MTKSVRERGVLKAADMDVVGHLFGIRFVGGCGPHKCAELYIEDDENYHFKFSCSALWLGDLERTASRAINHLTRDNPIPNSGKEMK